MKRERNSRPCLKLRVELRFIGEESKALYKVLKPDDVPVEGLDYDSRLEGNTLVYTFEGSSVLRLRNAVDDVLEKASLAEAVKKELGNVQRGR